MAGGFANSDPINALRTFNDIDNSRYQREVDYGTRRQAWLDQQAEVASNAATQVRMLSDNYAQSKAARDAGITDPAQLQDPQVRAKVEATLAANRAKYDDEFMIENKDVIEKTFGDLVRDNPHIKAKWAEQLGDHREFKGIRMGATRSPRVDPTTGQPMYDQKTGEMVYDDGPQKFGIVVANKKTGTTGLLDSTPDGKAHNTTSVAMTGSELLRNMISLGEGAVMSRGGTTVGSLETGMQANTDMSNQKVEEDRQSALRNSGAVSQAAARLANEGNKTHVLTDTGLGGAAVPAPARTVTVAGGFGQQPVEQAYTVPAGIAAPTPNDVPPAGSAGLETREGGVIEDAVKGYVNYGIDNVTAPLRLAKTEAQMLLSPIQRKVTEARARNINADVAAGRPPANGDIDAFVKDFSADGKPTSGFAVQAAMDAGITDENVLAEIRRRADAKFGGGKAPTTPLPPPTTARVGEYVDRFNGAAAAAGMSPAQYLATPAGKETWKVFQTKFKPEDIQAVNDAIVNMRADGRKLTQLNPRQKTALAFLQRVGAKGYSPEEIAMRQQGRHDPKDQLMGDLNAETLVDYLPKANSQAPLVNTSLGVAKMNERGESARASQRLEAERNVGKLNNDFITNIDSAVKARLGEERYKSDGGRLVGLVTGANSLLKRMGLSMGESQEHAMVAVDMAERLRNDFEKRNDGIIFDGPKLVDLTAELTRAQFPPSVKADYEEARATARKRNPNISEGEIMELYVQFREQNPLQ